ncbi:uncharacterized protein LOC116214392 [Punica granatum]|uniref:Uncharacterized protein LOC116214392 n=1 Tax=Punica granatum TaxID=22663 RepID=A0A6P8E6Q2_PUNGR|nr:uncharacterized protein LOC116214392 [Punica granatum]
MKKMEETIRALQASDPRHSTSYLDSTLFPGMQLPAKVKVPDFQKYDGTIDPRHHLRHYNEKMLHYWDYEQFVIATFQESLSGPALNWFISLRAEDIPSWTELAKKFVEQYQYNMETPPSFLELSTMEMAEGQKFEDYATSWRSEAAKHFPPICEAQQIQMFHGTLKGAYYSHLMGHKSTFSEMIMAGKQVDLGIKLGRLEGPTKKGEGESSRRTASAATPTGCRRSKEASVNAVNVGHNAPQQYSVSFTPATSTTPAYAPLLSPYPSQHPAQPIYYSAPPTTFPSAPQQVVHHYAPAPLQTPQYRPPASRTPQPSQQAPAPQGQQGGAMQARQRIQFTPLPTPLSHIYRQLLAGEMIRPTVPGPSFVPANQDQSLRCEYHSGAPGHTTDNCWKLREDVQKLINSKKISFNAIRPPNVQANPLPDHGSSSGPTINMISICTVREDESQQEGPTPFIIEYVPAEATVGFTGSSAAPAPFIIEVPAREPYQDSKVPWTYEGSVGNLEQQFSVMGVTCSGRVYTNPEIAGKGKAPAASRTAPEAPPIPQKKVTEKEAEAFMKVIKASEYKVVEQMGKSPAHISLLALLLSSEPHREALLRVLTAAQVPKEIALDQIEETVSSIFSNAISFSDDELPSEGWAHSRALHIVCKCNNFIIGRVMIDNGSALNVCPVSTLKQMNVDLNRVRPSKTAVRAFDGSRREVNGEIDLLIDVGPCSFSVTFQVLDIPNAFSLILGRPWIHSAGAVPSFLHQRIKFIADGRLITVKGEEDYAIYKETVVPYISIGDDENLPFHSFETISVIRDYGEVRPSRADRMVGKVLLRHNYVPGTGLGAQGQGINCPIEIEEYKNRRGLGFRPSCQEIIEARKGKHLHHLAAFYGKVNRGIPVLPLSRFFPAPPHIVGGTLEGPSSISDVELSICQPYAPSLRRLL